MYSHKWAGLLAVVVTAAAAGTQYQLLMAGNVVATIPLLVGFVLAQRWFVASMTFSGVKR
jgi:ABC-type glycerol-3-phosphate transport system permease component